MLTKKEGEKLEVKNFKICDFGLAMKENTKKIPQPNIKMKHRFA